MRFCGKVWRHIPAGAHPLHVGYILKSAGRWNRAGLYGCLYTSLTQEGALAELRKYLQRAGISDPAALKARVLVSLKVRVENVVDLTDPKTSPIDPASPFLTGDDPQDLQSCRRLADTLRAQGCSGIIAPSAAAPGSKNLVIYFDGPARDVDIDVGGDAIPIRWDELLGDH